MDLPIFNAATEGCLGIGFMFLFTAIKGTEIWEEEIFMNWKLN